MLLPRMEIRMGVPRTNPLIESIWGKIRILGVVKEGRRNADMEHIWRNGAILCNVLGEIWRRNMSEIIWDQGQIRTGVACVLASLDSGRMNGNGRWWWRRFAGQRRWWMSHGAQLLREGGVLELLPGDPLTKEHGKGKGRAAYMDGLWWCWNEWKKER